MCLRNRYSVSKGESGHVKEAHYAGISRRNHIFHVVRERDSFMVIDLEILIEKAGRVNASWSASSWLI